MARKQRPVTKSANITMADANRAVVKLVTSQKEASAGVLETLANISNAAKAEGFSGIAIAAADKAGYIHTAFERGENIALLIGAVERLKYRLLRDQDGS